MEHGRNGKSIAKRQPQGKAPREKKPTAGQCKDLVSRKYFECKPGVAFFLTDNNKLKKSDVKPSQLYVDRARRGLDTITTLSTEMNVDKYVLILARSVSHAQRTELNAPRKGYNA